MLGKRCLIDYGLQVVSFIVDGVQVLLLTRSLAVPIPVGRGSIIGYFFLRALAKQGGVRIVSEKGIILTPVSEGEGLFLLKVQGTA